MKNNPREIWLRQPGDKGWHYGDLVRVTKGSGMDEFAGRIGRVIGAEGEYLRIQFEPPVNVRGVGFVSDDLWMPYTLRKVRTSSRRNPVRKSLTVKNFLPLALVGGLIYWLSKK